MKSKLRFDPQKSLIELKVLWLVVGVFISFATIVALIIGINSQITPDYSYAGFNHALVVFRVPLAILALIIPIVALLAANHRSERTKEQIRVANEQNSFSNYYKHIEEFEKYLIKIWSSTHHTSSPRKLHKVLFPNARYGDFSVPASVWDSFNSMVTRFVEQSTELTACSKSDQNRILVEMQSTVQKFADSLYLTSYAGSSGSAVTYNGVQIIVQDGDIKLFVSQIQKVAHIFNEACSFELAYEPSETLQQMLNIDFTSLPSSKVMQEAVKPELDLSKWLNAA
ncbi:hypothetical protein [Shewanella sp. GXUN23E]|uniref:hypothetical protein n=1 Tax=Shewanella sp. GXUN23E TaxID=3422498 RepID=UPI003D7E3595